MLFHFSFKSSFLLIFFFHGLVFAFLLLRKGIINNDKPAFWLSLFAFLSSLYIAPFMLGYAGWYSNDPYRSILFYIPFQQLLLMPPVLYIYCKTLFDKSFVFQKKDGVHFLPALLYLLYTLAIAITDKAVLGYAYFYEDGRDKDFSLWYQLAGFGSLVFYLVKSLKLYKQYRFFTFNTVSYADALTFKWAQRFLSFLLLLVIIRGAFFIINPEWAEFGRKFWYYATFSVLFYAVTISGYVNSIRSITSFSDWSEMPGSNQNEPNQSDSLAAEQEHTDEKIQLPDLDSWKQQIETLMLSDKLYENPELSITDISTKLNTHSKRISQVINQGFGMNFNDFINRYRVEAVVDKMNEGGHLNQTLLSLAFESGFNSKSTFNRAFKRTTGMSPNEYVEKKFKK